MDSLETHAEASARASSGGELVNDQLAHIFLKRGQYGKATEYFENYAPHSCRRTANLTIRICMPINS